ncbi:MAG: N-acetylmannosamine-6-phosphate 2-epimerase [Bacteroidetes bacterium]|nr:N-acetylmannosamine-6-phosphate 2-epimerase [Bacteroidota bacterium]
MNQFLEQCKKGIIVSFSLDHDDPFNHPELIAKFAIAAEAGGACAVRIQGAENIRAVRSEISLPIIGSSEGTFASGWACITPDIKDIESLISAGADGIALDVTPRKRPNGMDGIEFFEEVRNRFDLPLIADIAIFEEGVRASEMGADAVATTLSGYTEYTNSKSDEYPDYLLIEELSRAVKIPVIAEGRIFSTTEAKQCIEKGAYAVVVGSAVTKPRIITQRFVKAIQ